MRKKSTSGVLASLRGSPYHEGTVSLFAHPAMCLAERKHVGLSESHEVTTEYSGT